MTAQQAWLRRPLRPPVTPRRLVTPLTMATFGVLAVVSLVFLDMDLSRVGASIGAVPDIARRALPPDPGVLGEALTAAVQTLWMAVLGTTLAAVVSLPVAVCAAHNTAPNRMVRTVARGIVVTSRVVPDIAFAMFFVVCTGVGTLPGVLALACHSVGMLGRLFTEAIERADPGPSEAAVTTGAKPLQRFFSGVLPEVVPAFLSAGLYRLDMNFRGATILGFVGAGGMGLLLLKYGGEPTTYPQLATTVLVVMACCLVFEGVSVVLREAVGGAVAGRRGRRDAKVPAFDRGRLGVPWTRARRRIWGFTVLAGTVVLVAAWRVGVDGGDFAKLGQFWPTVVSFVPTPHTFLDTGGGDPYWVELLGGLSQTLAVSFVAIVCCAIVGVPWGLLAAANVAPFPAVYAVARGGLVLARAVPEAAVAVLVVAVFGLEPTSAVIVLTLAVCPFLAKLVADVVEEVRPGPGEAALTTGASRLQEIVAGQWSQAVPSVTSSVLYAFDVMLRAIPLLGIIGVGALGYTMAQGFARLQYDLVGAIIVALFVVVLAIQLISDGLRRALG